MAANAVAPNILLLQFSIGSSIGVAATTVIGHSLGEERADQACRTVRLSLVLAVVCLTPTTILFMIMRRSLTSMFAMDEAVEQQLADLFKVVQVFAVFDNIQATLTGVLNGAGRQSIAAPLITICYWLIGLPIGVVLGFGFFGISALGLEGLWYGMIV